MKITSIVLGIIVLLLAGISYYFYDANRKTKKELEVLQETKSELESKIVDISTEKEEEIARLKGTYDQLVASMKDEIKQGQINITQMADRLSVTMVDKILFPSGEVEITPEGVAILTRIGEIIKNTRGEIIRVEGHTDNVRIAPRLQQKFPTNWELSTTRATNVVRFLQDQIGIEGARLRAVGMSEYHPVASNETREGRGQNRRIEIALLPGPP
jgi:chemotaxis protein MotB